MTPWLSLPMSQVTLLFPIYDDSRRIPPGLLLQHYVWVPFLLLLYVSENRIPLVFSFRNSPKWLMHPGYFSFYSRKVVLLFAYCSFISSGFISSKGGMNSSVLKEEWMGPVCPADDTHIKLVILFMWLASQLASKPRNKLHCCGFHDWTHTRFAMLTFLAAAAWPTFKICTSSSTSSSKW